MFEVVRSLLNSAEAQAIVVGPNLNELSFSFRKWGCRPASVGGYTLNYVRSEVFGSPFGFGRGALRESLFFRRQGVGHKHGSAGVAAAGLVLPGRHTGEFGHCNSWFVPTSVFF